MMLTKLRRPTGRKWNKKVKKLWLMHGGRCTKCNHECGIVRESIKDGWTHFESRHRLIKGEVRMKIATGEHIVPLSSGGTNEIDNLTLFCYECNHKTNAACFKRGAK